MSRKKKKGDISKDILENMAEKSGKETYEKEGMNDICNISIGKEEEGKR